jgi:molecular chaperone Hsp33
VLAADDEVAAGLLLQRQPVAADAAHEDYRRIATLCSTLRRDELLTLDAQTVLRRLFWEETVRGFEPLRPRFACTCSRERVRRMLQGLGRKEIESIIAEQGRVEIGCEFCGLRYEFDRVDAGDLFTQPRNQPPGSSTVQ